MYGFFISKAELEAQIKVTEQAVLNELRSRMIEVGINELHYKQGLMTIENNPPPTLLRNSRTTAIFDLNDAFRTNTIKNTAKDTSPLIKVDPLVLIKTDPLNAQGIL